jgi:hypothetical protein
MDEVRWKLVFPDQLRQPLPRARWPGIHTTCVNRTVRTTR